MTTIQVPDFNSNIQAHYERAKRMISDLSSSRQYNSEASLRGWRKLVRGLDPKMAGHKHFIGEFIDRKEDIELELGAVLIQYDSLYINAKFYASDWDYAPESEIHAELFQATEEGLKSIYSETSRKFKTWHQRIGREFSKLDNVAWPPYPTRKFQNIFALRE